MSVHVGKSSWFVHWDTRVPCLTERFRKEQRRKGAGVALSQMLPHCTRFLQLGLTQSVQGKCLFRVSQEKEEALKWVRQQSGWEGRAEAERTYSQEAIN